MINRRNYQLTRNHLAYVRDVYQVSESSLYRYWFHLRHVLLWAGNVFLGNCTGIRPTFLAYVASLPGSREAPSLPPVSQKKIMEVARRFFSWAKAAHPKDFNELPISWIETLRPPRLLRCSTSMCISRPKKLLLWRDSRWQAMTCPRGATRLRPPCCTYPGCGWAHSAPCPSRPSIFRKIRSGGGRK
jgi:hypothetical protein